MNMEGTRPARAILLPPRPIPDPVPLAEPGSYLRWWLALAILALAGGLILWAVRRRQSRTTRVASEARTIPDTMSPALHDDASPDTIEAAAAAIRRWLASRLGPGWLARTTESIVADSSLVSVIERDGWQDLVEILSAADSLKFRPRAANQAAVVHQNALDRRLARLHAIIDQLPQSAAAVRKAETRTG